MTTAPPTEVRTGLKTPESIGRNINILSTNVSSMFEMIPGSGDNLNARFGEMALPPGASYGISVDKDKGNLTGTFEMPNPKDSSKPVTERVDFSEVGNTFKGSGQLDVRHTRHLSLLYNGVGGELKRLHKLYTDKDPSFDRNHFNYLSSIYDSLNEVFQASNNTTLTNLAETNTPVINQVRREMLGGGPEDQARIRELEAKIRTTEEQLAKKDERAVQVQSRLAEIRTRLDQINQQLGKGEISPEQSGDLNYEKSGLEVEQLLLTATPAELRSFVVLERKEMVDLTTSNLQLKAQLDTANRKAAYAEGRATEAEASAKTAEERAIGAETRTLSAVANTLAPDALPADTGLDTLVKRLAKGIKPDAELSDKQITFLEGTVRRLIEKYLEMFGNPPQSSEEGKPPTELPALF